MVEIGMSSFFFIISIHLQSCDIKLLGTFIKMTELLRIYKNFNSNSL